MEEVTNSGPQKRTIFDGVSAVTKEIVVGAGNLGYRGGSSFCGIGPSDNQLDASIAN
jgi:hypothetical protein